MSVINLKVDCHTVKGRYRQRKAEKLDGVFIIHCCFSKSSISDCNSHKPDEFWWFQSCFCPFVLICGLVHLCFYLQKLNNIFGSTSSGLVICSPVLHVCCRICAVSFFGGP